MLKDNELRELRQADKTAVGVGSSIDCSKLGSAWTAFLSDETSLTFCYRFSWGNPEIAETGTNPSMRTGMVHHVSFPDAPHQPSVNGNRYPHISYSTLDFQILGDGDVPPILDWKELDFGKSEGDLAGLFSETDAIVKKLSVNGKQVLQVKRDYIGRLSQEHVTPLHYFIPNVVINGTAHNVHVIGAVEQEEDLDLLVESMRF